MPPLAIHAFSLASLFLWAGLSLLALARLGLRGAIVALLAGLLLAFGRFVVDGRLHGRGIRVAAGLLYGALALLAGWALLEPAKSEIITGVMILQLAVGVLGLLLLLRRARLDPHAARIAAPPGSP